MNRGMTTRRLLAVGLLPLLFPALALAADPAPEAIDFFEQRIRPILVEHCYECHGPEAKEPGGGLRLDSREAVRKGGASGSALTPGDPEKSLLILAVRHTDKDLKMPPEKKLSDVQIADLALW